MAEKYLSSIYTIYLFINLSILVTN